MSNTVLSVRAGAVGRLELVEAALQYLEGNVPAVIPLQLGTFTLGRGSSCDIQIKAQLDGKFIISRSHAMLIVDEKGCSIKDMGSTNGVYVNDQRIHTVTLQNGDIIRFAGMSEVPVGSFLTTSNVSVMYTVRLFGDEAVKKRAPPLLHASSLKTSAIDSAGTSLVVSSGSNSSGSGSKRAQMMAEEDQHEHKKARLIVAIEPSTLLPATALPPSSPPHVNSATVLHELKELKSMHMKELVEMREKFDSLQRALTGSRATLLDAGKPVPVTNPDSSIVAAQDAVVPVSHALHEANRSAASRPSLLSSLRPTLSCALCRDVLAFPVVLPCSHGYCTLCLERSMRKKKHLCPVCCDPPYDGATGGQRQVYHRSEHIENVVWIMLEASDNSEQEIKKYQDRLAGEARELKQLGVDVQTTYSHAEAHIASADTQASATFAPPPVTCEYCGSTANDHTERNCPHRMHREIDESSEDEL